MLLHNYVQHVKCLPPVTKNYELYYLLPEDGQLRPKYVGVFTKLFLTKVIVFKVLIC